MLPITADPIAWPGTTLMTDEANCLVEELEYASHRFPAASIVSAGYMRSVPSVPRSRSRLTLGGVSPISIRRRHDLAVLSVGIWQMSFAAVHRWSCKTTVDSSRSSPVSSGGLAAPPDGG